MSAWTGCRWPSNSRRPGPRPWRPARSRRGWTTRCGSWTAAADPRSPGPPYGRGDMLTRTRETTMAATANAREVIGEATLGELEGTLRGRLVRPSDPDYDQARLVALARITSSTSSPGHPIARGSPSTSDGRARPTRPWTRGPPAVHTSTSLPNPGRTKCRRPTRPTPMPAWSRSRTGTTRPTCSSSIRTSAPPAIVGQYPPPCGYRGPLYPNFGPAAAVRRRPVIVLDPMPAKSASTTWTRPELFAKTLARFSAVVVLPTPVLLIAYRDYPGPRVPVEGVVCHGGQATRHHRSFPRTEFGSTGP